MTRLLCFIFFTFLILTNVKAQEDSQEPMVRLVRIEIDPSNLSEYIRMLKEQMNTAVKLEEGVLEYHVVNEKDRPHSFTLIEIYKDREAYNLHINSPHFLKYKKGTEDMVKSLELIDANLIGQAMK